MKQLQIALKSTSKKLFKVNIEPQLTRTEERFGDYSTNVAMQLAKKLGKDRRQVAQAIIAELSSIDILAKKPEIAGPGFINFTLSDSSLFDCLKKAGKINQDYREKSVVVEYSDPNPFKILHVGHFYTSVVGDAIANLLELRGAKVHRVNFGGDVGLHVAKTMWAITQELGGEKPEKLNQVKDGPQWLAGCYIKGNNAYDNEPEIRTTVEELNKRIYQILEIGDKTSPLAQIYWTSRGWSYDYFDDFYAKIGTKFDKYYPESATVKPGLKLVKAHIGKIFEESDGAVVFKGEVHNLHTRVFINNQGLPTYETKDVGLMILKDRDYRFDKSIIITGNEQYEYMQVVLKAIEQIKPQLAAKTTHKTHGMVRLPGSQKMSSRKGNIVTAQSVLDMAKKANLEINRQESEEVALGAVKYSFLKQRLGADIIYDPKEAVSIEGNSGPYLQYAHARARSILAKTKSPQPKPQSQTNLDPSERSLARKISEYPEVVTRASEELLPHYVCTYLYELAQAFNRFYENSRVVGDPRAATRLKLVESYANVLKRGLELLNIPAPEKM